MSRIRFTELSKAISHALRHEPWLYELELDDEGWTDVSALVTALRQQGGAWAVLERIDIEHMLAASEKRRHEIVDDRIRALYGHSVPGKIERSRAEPPQVLFHGTAPDVAEIVLRNGLKPMGRQYVHFSVDEATAYEVALRKTRSPVLLVVAALAAHRHGIAFYVGNEKVWLADALPADFIQR